MTEERRLRAEMEAIAKVDEKQRQGEKYRLDTDKKRMNQLKQLRAEMDVLNRSFGTKPQARAEMFKLGSVVGIQLLATIVVFYVIYRNREIYVTVYDMYKPIIAPLLNSRTYSVIAAVICAYVLYLLRLFATGIYGSLEVFVGITSIVVSSSDISLEIGKTLPMLAGIYIIIRGLDNMSKAVKRGSWSELLWRRIFRKSPVNPLPDPPKYG